MHDRLLAQILRRRESLFRADLEAHETALSERIAGARVLVLGAAGSIGAAFVLQLLGHRPRTLHLVDLSENNLVELIRHLRSSLVPLPADLRTLPIGLGSRELAAFLDAERHYDYVLNFAALKHVRSEKDPHSLYRMVRTNAYDVHLLLDRLAAAPPLKFFSVSSDKAVNPESAMGATKALMERVLLRHAGRIPVAAARFANVAFSDGSLLHGFRQRLEKRQPLAAPLDVQRYFISPEEAGQLCLLACFLAENREIFIPRLERSAHLLTFAEIAELFLASHGLVARRCASEEQARDLAARLGEQPSEWPCYFFTSDTTGEKAVEEFFSAAEAVDWSRYRALGVVSPPALPDAAVDASLHAFEELGRAARWSKETILAALRLAVPELRHDEKGRSLDERM